MFRLLKEALTAPTQPPPSQARRTSATSAATPNPPGKRVSVSGPSEKTAWDYDSLQEVKREAKEEDWDVKRTVDAIKEWAGKQRPNKVDLTQIETVRTAFLIAILAC